MSGADEVEAAVAVAVSDLRFAHAPGSFELRVPKLEIGMGERVAVVGPSGCGKTTLLSLLAGIRTPDSGAVTVLGTDLARLTDRERRAFRIRRIGLVFQEFELVDHLLVRENILLPFFVNPALRPDPAAFESAAAVARSVGIGEQLSRRPHELSHGERQRVAICRALATDPEIVLADEPTGNLDPLTTQKILDVMLAQVEARGATFLMVTHDYSLLDRFDRVVDLGVEDPA